jgi:hypothetical protein
VPAEEDIVVVVAVAAEEDIVEVVVAVAANMGSGAAHGHTRWLVTVAVVRNHQPGTSLVGSEISADSLIYMVQVAVRRAGPEDVVHGQ